MKKLFIYIWLLALSFNSFGQSAAKVAVSQKINDSIRTNGVRSITAQTLNNVLQAINGVNMDTIQVLNTINNQKGQQSGIPGLINGKIPISYLAPFIDSVYSNSTGDSLYFRIATTGAIIGVQGGSSIPSSYLGSIYNQSSWTDLSDFTNVGATVSVVSNALQFSGGANNLNQTLQIPRPTCLEHWTIEMIASPVAMNSTSYGWGLGTKSTNTWQPSDGAVTFDMTTGPNSGRSRIWSLGSVIDSTTSLLAVAPGDLVDYIVQREVDTLRVSAFDITNPAAGPVTKSFTGNFGAITAGVMPNTGNFCIYSLGGTFNVYSLKVNSTEVLNAPVCIVGDSKADYIVSSKFRRYGDQLSYDLPNTCINAGPADRLVEVLTRLPELIAMSSKYYLLSIGRNDIAFGTDSNTIKTNYITLVSSLQAAGKTVIHLLPFWEPGVNQVWLVNWIKRTWPNSFIDTYSPILQAGGLALSDGVHLNDYGHFLIYTAILKAFLLVGGQHSQKWGLNDVLAYSNSANHDLIVGDGKLQCSNCYGLLAGGRAIHLTSGPENLDASIQFHSTKLAPGAFPGGSIVWRSDYGGAGVLPYFGDNAFAALQVRKNDSLNENFLFLLPDHSGGYAIPLELRSVHDPVEGNRYRITAQAGLNLFAGTSIGSSGASTFFNITQSVFAVDCGGLPLGFYNLQVNPFDSSAYYVMAIQKGGANTVAMPFPPPEGDSLGLSKVLGKHVLGQPLGLAGDPAKIKGIEEFPLDMSGIGSGLWLTPRNGYVSSRMRLTPYAMELDGSIDQNGAGAQVIVTDSVHSLLGLFGIKNDTTIVVASSGNGELDLFSNSGNVLIGGGVDDKTHLLQIAGSAIMKTINVYNIGNKPIDTANFKPVVKDANGNFYYTNWYLPNTGVTSVGISAPTTLLNYSSTPVTSTGTLGLTLANAPANSVWGNNTGSAATPGYQTDISISGNVTGNNISGTNFVGTGTMSINTGGMGGSIGGSGNNVSGQFTWTSPTSSGVGGSIAILLASNNFTTTTPRLFLFPTNANAAALMPSIWQYYSGSNNTVTVQINGGTFTSGTQYSFNYLIVQ